MVGYGCFQTMLKVPTNGFLYMMWLSTKDLQLMVLQVSLYYIYVITLHLLANKPQIKTSFRMWHDVTTNLRQRVDEGDT